MVLRDNLNCICCQLRILLPVVCGALTSCTLPLGGPFHNSARPLDAFSRFESHFRDIQEIRSFDRLEALDDIRPLSRPPVEFSARIPAYDGLTVFARGANNVVSDYRHFYSRRGLARLGLGLSEAAMIANTDDDYEIQDFYQRTFNGADSEKFAEQVEEVGDYTLTVPALVAASLLGHLLDDTRPGSTVSEWGYRSLRAVLVGEPMLLLLQKATGGSRPQETNESRWRPFEDENGVSGHSFIGAIPFLAAASMTERWYLRYPLLLVSMLPAWARVHSNDHFYSQAMMGWWLAYQSVWAVDPSLSRPTNFTVSPIILPDGVMFAFVMYF